MARFMRLDVYQQILETGLAPLFYHGDLDTAVEVVAACVRGGARTVEFTNRGDLAYPTFAALVQRFAKTDPNVILGVGSVQDAPTAALFIAAGANFVVGPGLNPEIARLCNRRKIAYIPGAATETEIEQAEEWGAEIVKLFPSDVLTPKFVRAALGPCPWHRLLATSGVDPTENSVSEWIKAGAAALGMGGKLISSQAIQQRAFDGITQKTAQVLGWIRDARGIR